MKEVLVLGAEGCGKTLFISRLKSVSQNGSSGSSSGSLSTSSSESEFTAPTVGVEITSIKWGSCDDDAFLVREVGSSLSLRWESFISECSCLVFLVDCSDCGSFSSSLVLLAEVLSAAVTLCSGSKSVLLAFNKSDLADSSTCAICYNVLDIDGLFSRTDINVTFVTGSSIDGSLCNAALRWMTACAMQP